MATGDYRLIQPYPPIYNPYQVFPYQKPNGPGVSAKVTINTTKSTVPKGWECPRCERINSPSVKQCSCKPNTENLCGLSEDFKGA